MVFLFTKSVLLGFSADAADYPSAHHIVGWTYRWLNAYRLWIRG
ncbi:hypothetical protein SP19_90 [Salmonella phage 19]|nr:hypothetical protein SP19_90 [Salmonella phage 19]